MCIQAKMQDLEQYMEQLTILKLGKESDMAAHNHSAYVKYMWTILFQMPGLMHNKLESRFLG